MRKRVSRSRGIPAKPGPTFTTPDALSRPAVPCANLLRTAGTRAILAGGNDAHAPQELQQTDCRTVDLERRLRLISRKLTAGDQDIRHALLDVCADFLNVAESIDQFPAYAHDEVRELCGELRRVRPRFPSHRETSLLFDREGLGLTGKKRASDLARRIVSLVQIVQRETPRDPQAS